MLSNYICDLVRKKGLIAGKYVCLLNNVYLHFCVCYNNSVSISIISINFNKKKIKWISYPEKKLVSLKYKNYGQNLTGYDPFLWCLNHLTSLMLLQVTVVYCIMYYISGSNLKSSESNTYASIHSSSKSRNLSNSISFS